MPHDIDWLLITALMTMLVLMCMVATGCHPIIYRPPIETARRAAEVEKDKAETEVLHAHAKIAEAYALCLSAKFAKDIPTLAEASKQCGNLPVSPVTVTIEHSRRMGDVSQFQIMPPIPFIGMFSTVLEETP